ncbi:DUF1826 domain-containing protein [Stutzerimonas nitrititolerans]|uniref:DUF1826 domain-containing protein n=1 Tax=Stutzerimonas nitrititolerans TaxID=2482751 RepID=UPI000EEDB424|nr:DUF1826 domain-containing protein [Stutzerimonas nitrititolerans]HCL78132.1 DUF1826 domain-containing protein [Pseudomonas sp.]
MPASQSRAQPRQAMGATADVLAEVLRDGVNLAVWERRLPERIEAFAAALVAMSGHLSESLTLELATEDAQPDLAGLAAGYQAIEGHAEFVADVVWLAQAYGCLLGARRIGLRLRVLDRTMCPRFHVDHVPLRLVITYAGFGSQWLTEGAMCRSGLGNPSAEPPNDAGVHQLDCGHVALIKGEKWLDNEGAGLVHRSPPMAAGERRLLLTMDWLG